MSPTSVRGLTNFLPRKSALKFRTRRSESTKPVGRSVESCAREKARLSGYAIWEQIAGLRNSRAASRSTSGVSVMFVGGFLCRGVPVGIPLAVAALEQSAYVAHLICALLAPAHSGSLHALADHGLACGFNR